MDLWQLHIFCKVVESRSFSKAGKLVNLSQPTVSSHIKDLEQHLDCRLIDRLSKQAAPTKAGEILYRYALKLLSLRDEAETAIAEFQGKMKGTLAVGGSTIPAGYLLPGIIGRFKKDFPEVKVSLTVGDTDMIIGEALEGNIEIGVVGAKPEDPRAEYEKLMEDEMRVVVPKGHLWSKRRFVSMEDLYSEPFITRERGSGSLRAIQRALALKGADGNTLNVVAEMGSTEAVYHGIKNRIGISILSMLAVREDVHRGDLVALIIEGLEIKRSFYLVRDRHRSASPLAKAFGAYLLSGKPV